MEGVELAIFKFLLRPPLALPGFEGLPLDSDGYADSYSGTTTVRLVVSFCLSYPLPLRSDVNLFPLFGQLVPTQSLTPYTPDGI